jgi:hypothetical protein
VERDLRSIFLTALVMARPHTLDEPTPQLEVRELKETGWVVPPGEYGLVPSAGSGIIRMDGIETDAGLEMLEKLGSPDPDSKDPEHGGRRVVRVDSGYLVLNFYKYRDRDYTAAERQRRLRARKKANPAPATEPPSGDAVTGNGSNAVTPDPNDPSTHASGCRCEVCEIIGRHGKNGHAVTVTQGEAEGEAEAKTTAVVVDARTENSPQTSPQTDSATPPTLQGDEEHADDPIRQGKDDSTRARELTVALNIGLRDNEAIGGAFMPVVATSGTNLLAAESIAEQGIAHAWAVRATYTLAKRFKPAKRGDTIGSLAWIVPRLARPWEQHRARIDVETATRPQEAIIDRKRHV